MTIQMCLVFVVVMLEDRSVAPQSPQSPPCERSRGGARAGVLGSVRVFPWLGVLRVHLHHETPMKIALTGIVLVKDKFAIGNADDIAKIPKRVFKEDARAMFIPTAGTLWFCRPLDFLTHPEYDLDTLNSLALIELTPPQDADFPMKPVCWPSFSYNTSNNLYVVGYTDENQVLEKFIHKLQYVEKDLCKEFYSRAGLTEGMKAPVHYECGFAPDNKDSCVWDNGMALVSNSSGHWVLVGLGLQGPGCAAPARFISLAHYYQWIESATNQIEADKEPNFRKSAFNEGFKKSKAIVEYVPVHELLRTGAEHEKHEFAHLHPHQALLHQDDLFLVQRVSGAEIQITSAKYPMLGSYGNCSDKSLRVIYKDYINVTSHDSIHPDNTGTVQYKMSLHDAMFLNYTCVTIKLFVKKASPAYLYYDTVMTDDTLFPENPDEIIRVYPIHKLTPLVTKGEHDDFTATHITTSGKNITAFNVNLYLKVMFQKDCAMEIKFYGQPGEVELPPLLLLTTSTTAVPTTEGSSTTTVDPYANLRKNIPLEIAQDVMKSRDVALEEETVYNNAHFTNSFKVWCWFVVILYFM